MDSSRSDTTCQYVVKMVLAKQHKNDMNVYLKRKETHNLDIHALQIDIMFNGVYTVDTNYQNIKTLTTRHVKLVFIIKVLF